MDAHGTRFHLLLGKDDWATCTGDNASWDEKRNELTLAPRLFRFQVPSQHSDPVVENRRGTARDRYGNWYWIDATRTEVLVNSSGNGQTTHFWSSEDGAAPARHGDFGGAAPGPASAAQAFGALSVTDHHYLVAGVLDPAGLLVFDLHGGGPPRQVAWPKSVCALRYGPGPRRRPLDIRPRQPQPVGSGPAVQRPGRRRGARSARPSLPTRRRKRHPQRAS